MRSSNYLHTYRNESSGKTINITNNSKNSKNSYKNNDSIQMSSSNSNANAFSEESDQEEIDSKSLDEVESPSSLE
jgi:hypothetical protein